MYRASISLFPASLVSHAEKDKAEDALEGEDIEDEDDDEDEIEVETEDEGGKADDKTAAAKTDDEAVEEAEEETEKLKAAEDVETTLLFTKNADKGWLSIQFLKDHKGVQYISVYSNLAFQANLTKSKKDWWQPRQYLARLSIRCPHLKPANQIHQQEQKNLCSPTRSNRILHLLRLTTDAHLKITTTTATQFKSLLIATKSNNLKKKLKKT